MKSGLLCLVSACLLLTGCGPASHHVTSTDTATFKRDVLNASQPVLVDFWAPWCGPCRLVDPRLEKLSNKYAGQILFKKLNVDESPEVAQQYHVEQIPQLLLFHEGKVVSVSIGVQRMKDYIQWIDQALQEMADVPYQPDIQEP